MDEIKTHKELRTKNFATYGKLNYLLGNIKLSPNYPLVDAKLTLKLQR
jgi:hypothetical protein